MMKTPLSLLRVAVLGGAAGGGAAGSARTGRCRRRGLDEWRGQRRGRRRGWRSGASSSGSAPGTSGSPSASPGVDNPPAKSTVKKKHKKSEPMKNESTTPTDNTKAPTTK